MIVDAMRLLDYMQAQRLLSRYGIRSVDSKYVTSADDAASFAGGDAIVLKVISDKALHKASHGLVALNLNSEEKVRASYRALERKARGLSPYKVLAQRMVGKGIEIIVGGKTDPQFGKLLLIGLGGTYVETFKDFALRVCPIGRSEAQSMLSQLKSSKIIAPDDRAERMIMTLLENASRLFLENKMDELDLNPIILHDGTYDAVDLRMLFQ
jgi:succinyl-CoA synthetase beta subunit